MRALLALGMAVLVSACDSSPPAQSEEPKLVRSEAQDRLHKLSEMDRAIVFRRAIYESGSACKRVEQTAFVQEHQNLSMWAVRCPGKRELALFVGPDGSVQVRDCADMAELKLPLCRIPEQRKTAASS